MTSGIVAALIAAVTSLLVSTIVAFRLERMKRSVALEDDDTRKALEFLGRSVEVLQEYRDRLRMIAAAPPASLSVDAAIAMLAESKEAFAALYKAGLPVTPSQIAKQTHDVKGLLLSITSNVETELRARGFTAALSTLAEHAASSLHDYQLMLLDARLEIRVRGLRQQFTSAKRRA